MNKLFQFLRIGIFLAIALLIAFVPFYEFGVWASENGANDVRGGSPAALALILLIPPFNLIYIALASTAYSVLAWTAKIAMI